MTSRGRPATRSNLAASAKVAEWPPPHHPLPSPGAATAAAPRMPVVSLEGILELPVSRQELVVPESAGPSPEDTSGGSSCAHGAPAAPSSSGAVVELFFTPDTLRRLAPGRILLPRAQHLQVTLPDPWRAQRRDGRRRGHGAAPVPYRHVTSGAGPFAA